MSSPAGCNHGVTGLNLCPVTLSFEKLSLSFKQEESTLWHECVRGSLLICRPVPWLVSLRCLGGRRRGVSFGKWIDLCCLQLLSILS